MAVGSSIMERIVTQSAQLPFGERLRLVQAIIDTLKPPRETAPQRHLIYGQFRGPRTSIMADFQVAEWHPTEAELNGA